MAVAFSFIALAPFKLFPGVCIFVEPYLHFVVFGFHWTWHARFAIYAFISYLHRGTPSIHHRGAACMKHVDGVAAGGGIGE